jgi:hypothetical protein
MTESQRAATVRERLKNGNGDGSAPSRSRLVDHRLEDDHDSNELVERLFTEVVQMSARSNLTTQMLCCALFAIGAMTLSAKHAIAQPLPCRFEVAAVIEAPTCGLGGVSTIGTAINPSGTTVVGYRFCLGAAMPWKWTQQTGLVMLALPPWLVEATPAGVNDNNIMVGTGVGPVAGSRGFLCDLETGIWTELMPQNPPIGWSGAGGINNDNTVVGFRSIDDGGDPVNPFNACIWHPIEGVTDLGLMNGPNSGAEDIAEDGTVVGWTGPNIANMVTRAFVRYGTVVTVLPAVPNGVSSSARGVGSSEYVGITGREQISKTTTANRGFIYNDGEFVPIGIPPGFVTNSTIDVNADGVAIAVAGQSDPNVTRGLVYERGLLRNLNDLITDPVIQGISFARAITPDGVIVATGATQTASGVTVLLEPVTVFGDAHPDCNVDVDDVIAVILEWAHHETPADVTGDGTVNVDDLIAVLLNWSP